MAVRCAVRMRYVCFAPGTGSRDDSSYRENVVVCDDSVASCGTGLLVADGDREGASACLGCGGEDSRDEQQRQWEKEEDCSYSHYRFFISCQFGNFRVTAPLLGAPLAVLGSTTSRAKKREPSVVTVSEIAVCCGSEV